MRVDRLAIVHYGPLAPRTLDLSAGAEGLHVIYGGNEWGKSLSLQALEHGLFSVPRKIEGFSDQDMAQLELALAVSRRAGGAAPHRLAFRRLRQKLTAPTSNDPLDERQVLSQVGGLTLDRFRQMYGLTSERIREGGRLLQRAKGDIATTLFAAATGLERIREVSRAIEARHADLFSPSSKAVNPRLNAAIRALRQSFSAYSSALQLPEATSRLEASLQDNERRVKEVEDEIARLSHRGNHLTRVRAARAAATQLHAARQRLAELGSPPLLSDSFRERLDRSRDAITSADTLERQLTNTLARQRARLHELVTDDRVLAAAGEISLLLQSTEELVGIDNSIPQQVGDIARLTEASATLFAGITATTGQPLRETAVLSAATHRQIEDLIAAHGGIAEACEQREALVKECDETLTRLEDELRSLAIVGDAHELVGRVQAVRDAGDLEKQLATKRAEVATLEQDHAAACSRLDGRQRDTPVDELRVPSLAEVREHREKLRGVETARAQIDTETLAATERIADLESQITLLEQETNLPAEGQLEAIRAARDAAIEAMNADAAEGKCPKSDRFMELTRLVTESDAIVDRLLKQAAQASQRRQHRVDIDRLRGQIRRLQARRDDISANAAAAEQDWTVLWQAAQIQPKSPTAMEEWLSIHAECRSRAAELRKLTRELGELQRSVDADRVILLGVLAELGIDGPREATRKQLLDAATAALNDRRTQANERQRKEDKLTELRQQLPRLKALLEGEIRKRDDWNKRWADCMATLAQPPGVSTETGRFLLDTMRAVLGNEEKIAIARSRIGKMEARRAEILEMMQRVCDALARPFDASAVREISQQANERLQANQQSLRDRKSLEDQIRESEDGLADIRQGRDTAEAVLTVLRQESGVERNDSLDSAWERSNRFRAIQSEVDDWAQQFLREAGDLDSEQLLDECIGTSPAAIDDESQHIDEEIAVRQSSRDRLRDEGNDLRRQVEALGGDRAARAWAECRMHEAEVLERVFEYLPLKLAAMALDRASRRYRDEHHAPVLRRASSIFERITGGRYSEIRIAEDDIYAVRADSARESVLQRFMSEGTRDQLYLALRLAALEHSHEQGAEPLPLILDDGLVQFDDTRTAAMLDVLADVSSGMQVILFTHHRSVVAAARDLQATRPEAVFLHGEATASA